MLIPELPLDRQIDYIKTIIASIGMLVIMTLLEVLIVLVLIYGCYLLTRKISREVSLTIKKIRG